MNQELNFSIDDFDNTDDKLPTLKKDIKSESRNVIKEYEPLLIEKIKKREFDDDFKTFLDISRNFKYKPKNEAEFRTLINEYINNKGVECDFNWIDTSEITDMSSLFKYSNFDGDISKWNVSNVKDMSEMFAYSHFNGDISNWNISKVRNMSYMFLNSKFKGNLSKWNVTKADITGMLEDCEISKTEEFLPLYNKRQSAKIMSACTSFFESFRYNCGLFFEDIFSFE